MVMTYLVEAMSQVSKPTGDVADEKIALLRIYLYREDILYISATVREEFEKIKNEMIDKRRNHQEAATVLLGDIRASDLELVESRMLEYNNHHSGEKNKKDCRILAEAELGGAQILLTYDDDFLKRLRDKTHSIKMLEPSKCWHGLGIPHGSSLIKGPRTTNPLSRETWWRW